MFVVFFVTSMMYDCLRDFYVCERNNETIRALLPCSFAVAPALERVMAAHLDAFSVIYFSCTDSPCAWHRPACRSRSLFLFQRIYVDLYRAWGQLFALKRRMMPTVTTSDCVAYTGEQRAQHCDAGVSLSGATTRPCGVHSDADSVVLLG